MAAGPDRIDEAGKRIAMDVQTGDVVRCAKYAGTDIKIDIRKLLIRKERDILAIG